MADTTVSKSGASKKTASTRSTSKKATRKSTKKATKKSSTSSPTKRTGTRPATESSAATSSPGRKTAAAKAAPARKTSRTRHDSGSGSQRPPSSGGQMAGAAREIVLGLTGRVPESVTALERSEDGWRVAVEVLELERIPSTTDVMATYEVRLDEQGELQGYRRVHRYLRGSPGDE